MKFAKLALAATAIAVTPFAASAQDVGTTIYSQVDESVVGTIDSNDGTNVLLNTGDYEATLPLNYFAERPVGDAGETAWTINATKGQIDAMMKDQQDKANAARDAALVEGAAVVSADGVPVGTIYTIDDADTAILKNESGIMTLTRDSFAVDGAGNLMALYSAEQITANIVAVPEGAEIMTPAQAAAKKAEAEAETAAAAGDAAEATM